MIKTLKQHVGLAAVLASGLLASQSAIASPVTLDGYEVNPMILAGDTNLYGDGGAPFVPAGVFTGVVSLFIDNDTSTPGGGVCTGSVISSRHIITAAHCVDPNDNGSGMSLGATSEILAVFNDGGAATGIGSAVNVVSHPDYLGFGVCGPGDASGLTSQCPNDDIAIITLGEDVPAGVEIYDFYTGDLSGGELFTMVGHGTTGNGVDGFTGGSDFFNKRFGFNNAELFGCDDANFGGAYTVPLCEANGSDTEVWYADFDGVDSLGLFDLFCVALANPLCDAGLGSDTTTGLFEASIGPGDSGGPSFVYDAAQDKFLLAANNTFGSQGIAENAGGYGEYFGGNIYRPYMDWISSVILANSAVSGPSSIGLLLFGLMMLAKRRRRS